MTVTIGRRELLVALGSAAAWPLAARAQQQATPIVGFLTGLEMERWEGPGNYSYAQRPLTG